MLAIVIPYYKLSFFEAALKSLSLQTDKQFKVYIGDDASQENPTDLLEKFRDKFEFVYHRFDSNIGQKCLVKQWGRCIALTEDEEWIMILGDDDELSENCIEDFYSNLPEIKHYDCNVVRYATIINDVVHKKLSITYTHPSLEKSTDFFYRRFTNQTRSSLSEYIFKKSAWKKHGFYNYNLAWHADDRAWLEFSEFKYIYSINSSHVIFRLSKENISRGGYKIKEKQKVTLQFYKFFIVRHLYRFSRYQRKDFLLYYEQLIYKNNKRTLFFWILLFLLFLANFYIVQSIKFTRRFLINRRRDGE
ncbi:glycosyltransferase family A protein [Flavobacterium psychrolimnae]|uniref:Glycosyltransferase family 2 protein n=1 Tax=Flavobacterium psychrolimnae TaxID=249351 RepID=A0A366AZM8_9FLAO|nr:glycosyltransferase family A protein [Flavobacterium psychrolimnae]RBN50312.1 glycosyltransferase family 2 protein [Flavobacterium psychrolimnae]